MHTEFNIPNLEVNEIIKRLLLLSFATIIFFLIGCTPSDNVKRELTVSSMFEASSYTMIGEKDRVGFIYDDGVTRFKPNREQKYMWHFWGEPEELEGEFKVIGKNSETGEEVTVFESSNLGGANNGADAHMPSSMSLPTTGVWELNAYVGGELFGTVVVECSE